MFRRFDPEQIFVCGLRLCEAGNKQSSQATKSESYSRYPELLHRFVNGGDIILLDLLLYGARAFTKHTLLLHVHPRSSSTQSAQLLLLCSKWRCETAKLLLTHQYKICSKPQAKETSQESFSTSLACRRCLQPETSVRLP
jgi:hypothetical protein